MKHFFAAHKLLCIYIISVIIFNRGIVHPFFQDDFIKIYLGWFDSFGDVFTLFGTYSQYSFLAFRPITDAFFGFIIFSIFHLNSIWTHILFFALHGLNLLLLHGFANHLIGDKRVVTLVLFLYAVSSIHFGTLYWLTANYMLFGTFLLLTILHILMKYRHSMRTGQILLMAVLYTLLLLSNEGLLLFPFLLLLLNMLVGIEHIRKVFFSLLTVSVGILLFRLRFSPFRSLPDYALGNPTEIGRTVLWYFYRVINMPESIKQMNGTLRSVVILFVACTLLFTAVGFVSVIRHRRAKNIRLIIFGTAWYFLFGLPYFLLPHHLSPYYLHTAAIGFFMAQALLLHSFLPTSRVLNRAVLIVFCFSYMLTSFINVQFYHTTHWIVWRANIAKYYIEKTLNLYPTLPSGATVVFNNTSISPDEIRVALFDDKALRLYYADRSLQVVYGKETAPDSRYFLVSDE